MRIALTLTLIGLLIPHAGANAQATSCSVRSGETTTALLELYTSEGCSSCPPADEWVASLSSRGLFPAHVVPLALHVDYWNYLGWIDPFAQKKFSDRQRDRAVINRERAIYTPQIVLNGRTLSRWHQRGEDAIRQNSNKKARADLSLEITRHVDRVRIVGNSKTRENLHESVEVFVALYERNITREIGAGENSGRTLRHDFVVHELIGPIKPEKHTTGGFTTQFQWDKRWKENDVGVAAFLQIPDTGEILQAVARDLCR